MTKVVIGWICLRDLITGEKSIQAFLNVYLGLSNLYIVHAEKEFGKGFVDLLLEPFLARYQGIQYSYLLEIKYIKREDGKTLLENSDDLKKIENRFKPEIKKMALAAEQQLRKYSSDEKLKKILDRTKLIKLMLIFSGHELVYIGDSNFQNR